MHFHAPIFYIYDICTFQGVREALSCSCCPVCLCGGMLPLCASAEPLLQTLQEQGWAVDVSTLVHLLRLCLHGKARIPPPVQCTVCLVVPPALLCAVFHTVLCPRFCVSCMHSCVLCAALYAVLSDVCASCLVFCVCCVCVYRVCCLVCMRALSCILSVLCCECICLSLCVCVCVFV